MQKLPLVSVIIPTYNGSKTIERAIRSVLSQDYPALEVIIIDDASTDRTVEVVSSIADQRIHLVRHSINKNGSAARNTGINASHGDYIAFLDDDDEWETRKISKQLNYLNSKDSSVWKGVVSSYWVSSSETWSKVIIEKEGDLSKDLLKMNLSLGSGSSMMFRREVFSRVGMFDEKYKRHQDIEFLLRYMREYKLAVTKEPLVKIYGHSGLVSGDKLLDVKEMFLTDFKKDIEKYGIRTANAIYARHWLQVARFYAKENNCLKTVKYLRKSLNYSFLFSKQLKVLPHESYFSTAYYLLKSCFRKVSEP